MVFGYEVTQRTTEKNLENHREKTLEISVALFFYFPGSLCNLISSKKPF